MQELKCPLCGRGKIEDCGNGTYHCAYCGSSFRDEFVEEQLDTVKSALGDMLSAQREEDVANARYNLWHAVQEEYTDSEKILAYCRELKTYLPKDFMANFYEVANSGSEYEINRFLDRIDEKKYSDFLPATLEFLLKSLELKNVSAVKGLIERAYPKHTKEYNDYTTRVEDEAVRLDEGMYLANLPRDVFLAYSSADMVRVNEVADYLESQGLKCFIALRNLRHGRGSVQNYEEKIFEAMRNCKCFVLLSSEQSRSLGCDALKIEIPYLRDFLPQMPRFEYLVEDYGKGTTDAAKILLKQAFKGLEWSTTKEDLLKNILTAVTAQPKAQDRNVKYCLACGTQNPLIAKRCMECGSAEFADSYKAYLDAGAEKRRQQVEAELLEQRRRLEEETIQRRREIEEQLAKEKAEIERKRQEAVAAQKAAEQEKRNRKLQEQQERQWAAQRRKQEENERKSALKAEKKQRNREKIKALAIDFNGVILGLGIGLAVLCVLEFLLIFFNPVYVSSEVRSTLFWVGDIILGLAMIGCTVGYFVELADSLDLRKGIICAIPIVLFILWSVGAIVAGCVTGQIYRWAMIYCIAGSVAVVCLGVAGCLIKRIDIISLSLAFFLFGMIGCGITNVAQNHSTWGYEGYLYCSDDEHYQVGMDWIFVEYGASARVNRYDMETLTVPAAILSSKTIVSFKAPFVKEENEILKTVALPASLKEIGEYAFRDCKGLLSVEIPKNVQKIGKYAFENCSSLEGIFIPQSVSMIETGAFAGCDSLTIYCERESEPVTGTLGISAWGYQWNGNCKVVWGYKGESS